MLKQRMAISYAFLFIHNIWKNKQQTEPCGELSSSNWLEDVIDLSSGEKHWSFVNASGARHCKLAFCIIPANNVRLSICE